MKKKILIGSMLVLSLLLLMPSIPAVQTNTIKEDIKQNIHKDEDDCDRCPPSNLKLDNPNGERPICDILEKMFFYYGNRMKFLHDIFFSEALHWLHSIEIIRFLFVTYVCLRFGSFVVFSMFTARLLFCDWMWPTP
jgi:hypothetical protein